MGCDHEKEHRSHLWCHPCAERFAGSRPQKTWEPGFYALNQNGEVGVVTDVKVTLAGIATEKPVWWEQLDITFSHGHGGGHKDFYTRLVAAPEGWDRPCAAKKGNTNG